MKRACVASLFLCLTTTLALSQRNPPLTDSQSAQNVARRLVQRVATPPLPATSYKSPVMRRLLAQKHNHQATAMSLTSGQDLTSPFLTTPPMYAAGSGPFDLALGNFTSDGKQDIIVAADPPVLLLGNGDGTFQAAAQIGTTSSAPTGVAVADFNRDGHLDAVFAISGGAVVYLGNGHGTFGAGITVSSGGTNENEYPRVLAADANNDGIPDLILNTDAGISVLLGRGNGTFQAPIFSSAPPPLSAFPAAIAFMSAADFNRDGKVDLAVTNGYNSVSIMLGNGSGTFTVAGNYSTSNVQNLNAIAIADYNRDGFQDVALPNGQIFLGNGNGTLQAPSIFPTSPNATVVAAVDVNGDGIPDLLTSSSGFLCGDGDFGTTGVSLGNGDGTFQPVTVYDSGGCTYPVFMAIGDLNNDVAPDIVVLNADLSGTALSVLINKGKGKFPAAILNISGGSGGVAVNDFNHDGNADVVLANGSVYLGHGDGTLRFKASVSLGAVAVATGDFTRDRNPDLAAAVECAPAGCSSGGQLLIAKGNGNGTFQTPTALPSGGFYAESLAVADFNHDGNLEVALVNQCADSGCAAGAGSVSIFLGNANGTFTLLNTISLTSGNPSSIVAGDFNNDGVVDLAIGFITPLFEPGIVNILLGNGDGSFQSPIVSEGGANGITALAVGDFNNDGILDLAVANGAVCSDCGGQGTVLYGNGDGTLTVGPEIPTEGGPPVSAVAADFYGIGTPTPVLANVCGDSLDCPFGSVMIGGSPWEQALDQTYIMLQFLAVGDFNNDGKPDLVGSLQYDAGVSVLLDTGATLAATTTTISPSAPTLYSAFQPVTFTAQIRHTGPGRSVGRVNFLDSGVLIGSAPVNCDGQASFTTTGLAVGSHFVVAYYEGDSRFAPSNSLGVHVTIKHGHSR
jgi:Bacterial Ig-like domain (group 3)/FG-GAP-like repeat